MELQEVHNLGHSCPGQALPVRNLGSVFNFPGVELPLPLSSAWASRFTIVGGLNFLGRKRFLALSRSMKYPDSKFVLEDVPGSPRKPSHNREGLSFGTEVQPSMGRPNRGWC